MTSLKQCVDRRSAIFLFIWLDIWHVPPDVWDLQPRGQLDRHGDRGLAANVEREPERQAV